MRVLLIPELYRPEETSANGTLADAVTWVERWLDRDPGLHVYWLVPPETPAEEILADRERVTAIRAEPFGRGGAGAAEPGATDAKSRAAAEEESGIFTEGGYSWAELSAIEREIYDRGAYLDCVVDQRRTGRFDLHKWLCHQTDRWAADVAPFEIIANVHDLQTPRKYRYCSYRGPFQSRMEMASALFADGIWFKAGIDAERLRERATDCFQPEVVEAALADAIETGSPIDFADFEESYADDPQFLHLAGSFWSKKNADVLLGIGERLHDEFGVETLLTSMEPIPDEYAAPDWVHAYPEADRETYEETLRRGDLAVCASEYETMARTPFEQAASGQVLVLRDEPWIYDCVPEEYALAGDPEELADLAAEAVRNWDDAVRENRRMVAHVKEVRDPDLSARRTYRDLRQRVESKRETYELGPEDAPVRAALADADAGESAPSQTRLRAEARKSASAGAGESADVSEDAAGGSEDAAGANEDALSRAINLNILREATAMYTDDGRPVTDDQDYALADLVYALRSLGYRDAGNPGTPVFVRG